MCQETSSIGEPHRTSIEEPLLQCEGSGDTDRNVDRDDDAPPSRPSRNILLTLIFTAIAFAGRSLWSQSVLSTFVYLLEDNDPKAVGYITGVMGLAQLVSSFPTGVLADHYRRDTLLKGASAVGLLAIGLTLTAVLIKQSYLWLTLALAIWGVFWGMANTALGALFADSVPNGQRSKYFTQRFILLKFGNMAGPSTALILFAFLGNEWTIGDCATVMAVGNGVCVPALVLLCFLSDSHIAQEEDTTDEQPLIEPLLTETNNTSEEEATRDRQSVDSICCLPEHRIVPILISAADILSGLGSGMSIRYFPIFFLDNLKLSPVLVQVLYIVAPLGQAILMHYGQLLSKVIGRCHMAVLYKFTGISFMLMMIASYHYKLPLWTTCAFYVLRTSFMNSTTALTKSVLMDAVPRDERGKWSALESVNMFGWSGSAVLGGLLVGKFGLLLNFGVTALIQLLATAPLVMLWSRDFAEGTSPLTTTPRSRLSTVEEDSERSSSNSSNAC